ncbi:fungal chitin synthase, partial [Caulochytrium protostelioides]
MKNEPGSVVRCQVSTIILYTCTGVIVGIMVIKFLAALQFTKKRLPEKFDRFVILQVPCYTEGEASLRKTIDSLALLDYDDTRKLLFLIADGMVKGAGNDLPTPDLVLKILGVNPEAISAEAYSYVSIGEGSKQHNKAKVYSGLYSIQARYIPFLVVVKCGKETETSRAGNRGKCDSQIIIMRFLNRVHYQAPMNPLELEMYHHMKNIIGVDPYLYEYTLMVDADTEVEADSLNRLIAVMVTDGKIMGLCGETKIRNERSSWVTMLQVFEYYISQNCTKAFESLFGNVTCLPGCFCMYRIRSPEKKIPLLIASDVIAQYEENKVDTLHKKNLLSLGEDRYLTTLMLKTFPEYRNKFTGDALCYTIVPDQFAVLLSQRRRWINSTVHNLFELLFLPELCGCLLFSMRTVVFMDLFATLIMPAVTCYLVYLIYNVAAAGEVATITVIMICASYGLQAIIFLLKRQWQHIGWLVVSILALPVFSFWLPLYAYWHFDDFSWGNTRKI